jgi:sugar phosphate isomerase/epimerase
MARSRFALHTWTLDSTPLARVLEIARAGGWDAVELRYLDFARAIERGERPDDILDLVRASGMSVSAVGARLGWMYAEGEERQALVGIFRQVCRWAVALGARVVQSPVDFGEGDIRAAAARLREMGDLAGEQGLRLAIEPYVIARQFNSLARGRELLALADHPACGLDVDAYHLHRTGDGVHRVADLRLEEIVYVQFSDVPVDAAPAKEPRDLQDRLPPGQGVIPFVDFFRLLGEKGYAGYASYEAPNPAAWGRDPEAVAREALAAARQVAAGSR